MPFSFLKRITKHFTVILLTAFSAYSFSQAPTSYEDALKSFHAEKYDETIIHLKNALKDNAEHIPSRLLLAETLIAQGNGAMAETELADLQDAGVDVNQLVTLKAQALLLQSKFAQVISDITPGYRGNAIESEVQLYLGQAHLARNRLRDAETAFITALQLAPDLHQANLGLAQVAINRGQLDRAMKFVELALSAYEPLANAWIMKSKVERLQYNFKSALLAAEEAVNISPNNIEARLNRAAILIAQKQPEQAIEDLEFILEKIPEEPRAKYLLALVNASAGDDQGSEKKLAEVVDTLNSIEDEVMENNPSYYYLAGLTNFKFGNLNEADHYLRSYLRVKENDVNALRLQGMVELRLGNFGSAKKYLTKANLYFPNNLNILTLLGITAMKSNDFATAERYFEQVMLLKPELEGDAVKNLARSKMASGNYQEAISHLLELNEGVNEDEIGLMLVESYLKSKQYNKAKSLSLKLGLKYPENAYIAKQHAILLSLTGEKAQARKFFEKAVKLDQNDFEATIHLARMDVAEEKVESALARINKLLEQDKENLTLMHELANIYLLMGDKAQAHTWYEKAFAQHRSSQLALSKVVASFISMQQQAKAIETLQEFIRSNKDVDEPRLMLGKLFLSQNQPQKAIKLFERSVKTELDKARVYMLLTRAYLVIDDRDSASLALTKAIAWDENRVDAMEMLFKLSIKLNNIETAKEMIAKISEQLPNAPLAEKLSGDLAMHLSKYSDAENFYKKAIAIKENQRAVMGLYSAYIQQKKYSSARKTLSSWLKTNPNDVIADIGIAESYQIEKKYSKAISRYHDLVEKYRRMPILLNNLANIYLAQGKLEQAKTLAQEAYEKAPKITSIIDTYAWILSRSGKSKEALPLFREALVLDFKNSEVKYHLAVTLDKEERRNEAKKLLIEAVQGEDDFAEKKQAKQLLEQWLGR